MGCTLSVHMPAPAAQDGDVITPPPVKRAKSRRNNRSHATSTNVSEWTAGQVADWIHSLDARFESFAAVLEEEGVDGRTLLYIDSATLSSAALAVYTTPLQRLRLLASIDGLRGGVVVPPAAAIVPVPRAASPPAPAAPLHPSAAAPAPHAMTHASALPAAPQRPTEAAAASSGQGVSLSTAIAATAVTAVVAAAVEGGNALAAANVEGGRVTRALDATVEKAGSLASTLAAAAPGATAVLQSVVEKASGGTGGAVMAAVGAAAAGVLAASVSLMDIAQAAPFIAPAAVAVKMLYSMAMQAIANKKNCEKMAERLKAHERVLCRLGATKLSGQVAFLDTLVGHINKAVDFISGFSKKGWLRRVLSNASDADTFAELQGDIDRTVSDIQFALQVEVFAAVTEGPSHAPAYEDEGSAAREYVASHGGIKAVMEDAELRKGLTDNLGVADQMVMGELEEIKSALAALAQGVTDMHEDVRKLLELTTAATARPVRAALYGVPPLPAYFVDFTHRVAAIVDALTPAGEDARPCAAIVYGFAGLGKSIFTAAAAVQADGVRKRYRDGILWLRVGQRADKLDILATLASNAHGALSTWNLNLKRCPALDGDVAPGITAVNVVTTYLTSLLADRAMLLVLDDVWDADILASVAALGCSFIATTRSKSLAEAAGAAVIPLDVLSEDDALHMMTSILGLRALPGPTATAVLACAKGIPLTIALLSSMMKNKSPGRDTSWGSTLAALQQGDSVATDTLHKAVQLSIDDLPRDARKRLRALAFASAVTPLPLAMLQAVLDLETEGDARDFATLLDDRCLARVVDVTPDGAVRGMLMPDVVLDVIKDAAAPADIASHVARAAAWLSQLSSFALFDEPSSRWLELSGQWAALQAHDAALDVTAAYITSLREASTSGDLTNVALGRAAARVTRFMLERDAASSARLQQALAGVLPSLPPADTAPAASTLWQLASLCSRAYLPVKAEGAAVQEGDVALVVHALRSHALTDWACADVAATTVAQLASRSRRPRGDDAADKLIAGGCMAAVSPLLAAYADNICIFRKVVTALDTLSRGAPSARTMAGAQQLLPDDTAAALVAVLRSQRNDVHIVALLCNSLRTMIMGNAGNQEVLLRAGIVPELIASLRAHEGSCIITQWITATLCATVKGSADNQRAVAEADGAAALLHATRFWVDGMRSGSMTPAVADSDGDLAISGCVAALAACGATGADSEGLRVAASLLQDAQRGPAAIAAMFAALPDLAGATGFGAMDAPTLASMAVYLQQLCGKLAARAASASSAALPPAGDGAAAAPAAALRTPVNERLPEALVLTHATEALAKMAAANVAAAKAALRTGDMVAALKQLQVYTREGSRADVALNAVAACLSDAAA